MVDPTRARPPRWLAAAAFVISGLPRGQFFAAHFMRHWRIAPFWAHLPADLGGMAFRCDLRDTSMREVYFVGSFEAPVTEVLKQELGPGMVFVDVGANWGYFTLLGAHLVGPSGRVFAVEADPRAARALREFTARNNLETVSILEMAASDAPGVLQLQEYDSEASELGAYGVKTPTTRADGGRIFEVPARTLDDTLDEAGVDRVDVLKMDIEGGEARALSGLARRLAAGRVSTVLLELHPEYLREQGSSWQAVVDRLRLWGFELVTIDHSRVTLRKVAKGRMPIAAALSPLTEGQEIGRWPHVLGKRASRVKA